MSVFVSAPTAFSGLGALQSRRTTEPFAVEEQYFQALAEAHERAASFARQRVEAARRQQQQQRELRAKLLLQEHIAAASQAYTPRRSPYQTLRGLNSRVSHPTSDIIFDFGADDNDAYDAYAERMHRQSQAAFLERQKRAQQNDHLRSLFENQRRIQAAKVAELHRRRVEEAEQERRRKAQEQAERARRHVASRAADKERLEQFVQALFDAMSPAQPQPQGSDLERKNAIHRTSVPAPVKEAQSAASASASNSSKVPERASSPAPSVASDASDASLNSIASVQSKYESLRSGFTFPSALAFAPAEGPITPASAPTLPYNVTNAPVHAYEHALTNLLTQLDAIDSFGDEHVRDVRRSLVKSVEAELEALEEKKREAWRNQVEFKAATPSPVESFPRIIEPESIPAPESDLSNPISLVAARLSEAPESEDEEIKVVRENLLASLSAPAADDTALADSQLVQDELQVVVNLPSEPDFTVPITPQAPVESIESPIKPTVEIAPEHEVVEAHIPTLVTEVGTSEAVIEQPATEPVIATPGSEPVLIESVPGTEVVPASPTESEPVSVIAASEPEVITKVQDEIPSTFVQVYPDSDSDVDTDADLTSEISEAEKKSGDEFELV